MNPKVLLVALFCSFQVQAASELLEKNQALSVVKNYANSIACSTSFKKDENGKIHASVDDVYIVNNEVDKGLHNELYVLWAGDQQCAGGSGTFYATLTSVTKWTKDKPYIVTGDYPFGENVDKHINYRFISEFKQLEPNLFKITSGKLAEDDPSSTPSLQDSIVIEEQDGAGWKVISSRVSKLEN